MCLLDKKESPYYDWQTFLLKCSQLEGELLTHVTDTRSSEKRRKGLYYC